MTSFREKYEFDKRKLEADRRRAKYPTKVPIIVEKMKNSTIPELDKSKFLVPADLTVGQFIHIIRKPSDDDHKKTSDAFRFSICCFVDIVRYFNHSRLHNIFRLMIILKNSM